MLGEKREATAAAIHMIRVAAIGVYTGGRTGREEFGHATCDRRKLGNLWFASKFQNIDTRKHQPETLRWEETRFR